MLTPDQIAGQSSTPALTDDQILNLMLLVKRYPVYVGNLGLFPDLAGELATEQGTPTVKTKALKAVLAAVNELPEVVVESQGKDTAPSHFTTNENWNNLALDVLNLFFDVPAGALSRQSFALAQRKVENILIADDMDLMFKDSLLRR